MKQCVNWNKVIANAGLAFCTTLLATGLNAQFAIVNATLIAGVALFTEIKSESEPINKVKRALSVGLVA